MRLIDADALTRRLDFCVKEGMGSTIAYTFKHMVADAPTIDAVEVVRCKDCKHYESDGGAMMICNITDMVCDDDDYCSYGEREGE